MKLTKSTSRMRQPLNVFCRKHGTVEPTVSFYKGNQEIFGVYSCTRLSFKKRRK